MNRWLGATAIALVGGVGLVVTIVQGAGTSLSYHQSVPMIAADSAIAATNTPGPVPFIPSVAIASPTPFYANCDAARAAHAAPVYRGQPGYRPALDRDNDGIGCE